MMSLLDALDILQQSHFVDLTHAFSLSEEHCQTVEAAEDERERTRRPHPIERWGTHVEPPRGLTLDRIPVTEMIAPLAVIDISERAYVDPDAEVSINDIQSWERRYGELPPGVFVALQTGWSRHWPNIEKMANRDQVGVAHFPGWSCEVLRFLVEERDVVAIGHDTPDTDAGRVVSRGQAPLEEYWLRKGRWKVDLLANLDQIPPYGAIIFATWPKPRGGSGFPARCFAVSENSGFS